jgi:hypothetical protein
MLKLIRLRILSLTVLYSLACCSLYVRKGIRSSFYTALVRISSVLNGPNHRLSINSPAKSGKEKSPSEGHCQCQKKMDDLLLACLQFLTESHIVTRLVNERAALLNMNDINK